MSSFLDDTMKEMAEEQPNPVENTTTEETKVEEQPAVEDPKPAVEDQPKPGEDEDKPGEDKPGQEDQPKPDEDHPKPKKDLSNLSKEQKAEFAFRRQLEKQRSKYESEISKMAEQFSSIQKSIDELKTSKSSKEETKTRTDFDSDDEYISYLAEQKVKGIMAERDAESKKQSEADAAQKAMEEEEARHQQEVTQVFTQNCARAFTDEAEYAEFAKKVNKALSNGIGEVLDQVPTVRDYLFQNPNGPVVLNKMLSDRDSFVRVMKMASNPIEAAIELHEMAKELSAPREQPPENRNIMPNIGKPGKGASTSAPDVFASDESLLKYIRGR